MKKNNWANKNTSNNKSVPASPSSTPNKLKGQMTSKTYTAVNHYKEFDIIEPLTSRNSFEKFLASSASNNTIKIVAKPSSAYKSQLNSPRNSTLKLSSLIQ